MIWCENEKIPIGLSHVRCDKHVKVNWQQWTDELSEWMDGYKLDLTQYSVGDEVLCPVCGKKVDFRFWMSDVMPHLVQKVKGETNDPIFNNPKSPKPQEPDAGIIQGF